MAYCFASTPKECLYKAAKPYGYTHSYRRATVKGMEAHLVSQAERIAFWVRNEASCYSWETAERNGIRYILAPGFDNWMIACKNLSGHGRLEAFRLLLRREFRWNNKQLNEVCAIIRERGQNAELPHVSSEVLPYERVCLYAYAMVTC